MNKVVQLCSFKSVYNSNLQMQLQLREDYSKRHITEVIYFEEEIDKFESRSGLHYRNLNVFRKLEYWHKFNKYFIESYSFDSKQDVVNIQFIDFRYLFMVKTLKRTFNKIILTFWGSDLLRQRKMKLWLMMYLFSAADIITFETKEMVKIFHDKVGKKYDNKIREVKFGLSLLDLIDTITDADVSNFSKKYKIDTSRLIVVVGYNRIWQQQHLPVIESIKRYNLPKNKIFIIFPWTYGNDDGEYKQNIIKEVDGKYDYIFLTDDMNDSEIACLRKITDILIQVQISDSLSATMLETLYAGKQVITGNWLPYEDIINDGITLNLVSDPREVGKCIKSLMENEKKASINNNHCIIHLMSSWEENISNWIEMYN